MGKKAITFANVIVIQYLLTSQYQVAHKWEWLLLTAIVLAALLVLWNPPSRTPDAGSAARPADHEPHDGNHVP